MSSIYYWLKHLNDGVLACSLICWPLLAFLTLTPATAADFSSRYDFSSNVCAPASCMQGLWLALAHCGSYLFIFVIFPRKQSSKSFQWISSWISGKALTAEILRLLTNMAQGSSRCCFLPQNCTLYSSHVFCGSNRLQGLHTLVPLPPWQVSSCHLCPVRNPCPEPKQFHWVVLPIN